MKTFDCQCGGKLFFGDVICVSCSHRVVRCAACEGTTAVERLKPTGDPAVKTVRCLNHDCGQTLRVCQNSATHGVCNGTLRTDEDGATLCRYCRLNAIIPSLKIEGNLQKWLSLETAKHRVLAGFENAGFRLDAAPNTKAPPLRFQFKQDGQEKVTTGHWNGTITIKLAEADSVFRERNRVRFGETKRTLTDHFRHELGHYVWDWLVKPNRVDEFREIFGDEREPTYADALKSHYANGAPADWRKRHVTEYATTHPWEDFAETFRVYLEMQAALDTGKHFGLIPETDGRLDSDFTAFLRFGIALTEISREFGFADMVSASMPNPVRQKLRFISELPPLIDELLAGPSQQTATAAAPPASVPAPPPAKKRQTQSLAG